MSSRLANEILYTSIFCDGKTGMLKWFMDPWFSTVGTKRPGLTLQILLRLFFCKQSKTMSNSLILFFPKLPPLRLLVP
ncbi:hypothetical protein HanIR_Chr12g0599141 [Helianthus annuus]|nr:hypothetical protein HanIR_Chr12g0599141 [Helianthus annuus]